MSISINPFMNTAAKLGYGHTNSLSKVTMNNEEMSLAARGLIFTQSGWGDGFNITSANLDPLKEGNGCLNRYCQGKNTYDEFGNTPTSTLFLTA